MNAIDRLLTWQSACAVDEARHVNFLHDRIRPDEDELRYCREYTEDPEALLKPFRVIVFRQIAVSDTEHRNSRKTWWCIGRSYESFEAAAVEAIADMASSGLISLE